ncbi:MAG: PEP-CTERM sorting domain-containing protein [Aquabacterium sp.]
MNRTTLATQFAAALLCAGATLAASAQTHYNGPTQTFTGTTGPDGSLDIHFINPDRYLNMTDLTVTLIPLAGSQGYHLDGYGFPGGPTPTLSDDRMSLRLTNISVAAGFPFDFTIFIDQYPYKPGDDVVKYASGPVKYSLTPSYDFPPSVPEPEAVALSAAGLLVVTAMARRKKRGA